MSNTSTGIIAQQTFLILSLRFHLYQPCWCKGTINHLKLGPEENHQQYGADGVRSALNTLLTQPVGCWDTAKWEGGKGEGVTVMCLCFSCSWLLRWFFSVERKLQKGFAALISTGDSPAFEAAWTCILQLCLLTFVALYSTGNCNTAQ